MLSHSMVFLALIVGLALGAACAWLVMRARIADANQLRETFSSLSSEALRSNAESFLQLATAQLGQTHVAATGELERRKQEVEQLVRPLAEALKNFEQIDREHRRTTGELQQHLRTLAHGQERLQAETQSLSAALRSPVARGNWGELTLRRVCELAGMMRHCDFTEQSTLHTEDGRVRPDVVVHLPGGTSIVVDAKVPLSSYLDAQATDDPDAKKAALASYGQHVRDHVKRLADRAYWTHLDSAADFVVMFLPNDALYAAALEQVPSLVEEAPAKSVLIATPSTLIGLLWAVSRGWRDEQIAQSAREVSEAGRTLHERLGVFAGHFAKIGSQLAGALGAYNQAVGSYETRVLPAARKLEEGGAGSDKDVGAPALLEAAPRPLTTPVQAPDTAGELAAAEQAALPRLAAAGE